MPNWSELAEILGRNASKEAPVAEKGVNLKALAALKAERDAQNAMASDLAAGSDRPLANDSLRNQLGDLDISSLPASKQAEILGPTNPNSLVPSSRDPNFTLGESSDIPSTKIPKEPLALTDQSKPLPADDMPKQLPALTDQPTDLSGVNMPSSAEERANKWKNLGLVGAAGIGATAAVNMGGGSSNQAASAPKASAIPEVPVSKKPDVQEDDSDDEDASEENSSYPKSSVSKAPSKVESPPTSKSQYRPANNIASDDELKKLQDRASLLNAFANFRQSGEGLSYDIAGIPRPVGLDTKSGAEGMRAQAKALTDNYQARVDFQKQDPQSAISQTYRKMAGQLDIPVHEQTSAAELEKAFPQMVNIKTREDMIEARKDIAQQRTDEQHYRNQMLQLQMQDRQTQKQHDADLKQAQIDDKRLDSWAKTIAVPSNRSALGQATAQINSIQRVQQLLHGHPLSEINPQEAAEVYKGLDRVISGGSPTIQGAKSLDPNTAMAGITQLMQRFGNQSVGAQSGNFLSRVDKNLNNEMDLSRQQVKERASMLLAGADKFTQRSPENAQTMRDFLSRSGLPTDLFDDHGTALVRAEVLGQATNKKPAVKPPQMSMSPSSNSDQASSARKLGISSQDLAGIDAVKAKEGVLPSDNQDPKIAKYSQDYGLQYDQAAKILKSRGYNAGQ